MGVFLGYDSNAVRDGSGAQVQRVLAIYCMAQYLGINYAHSRICDVDFNPGDGIKTISHMKKYIEKLNYFLKDLTINEPVKPVVTKLDLNFFFRWFFIAKLFFIVKGLQSKLLQEDYLYLVSDPYIFMERHPEAYTRLTGIKELINPVSKKKRISIQMHLVRAKTSSLSMPERFTEDDWYLEILDKVLFEISTRGLDFEILLHTDVSDKKIWRVPKGANTETLKFWDSAGILDKNRNLNLQDRSVLEKFYKYPNLSVISNIDPVEAWKIMGRADLLLMGKSSFSFVGALLNSSGIIFTPPFWHAGPKSWHVVSDRDTLDTKDIFTILDQSGVWTKKLS